MPSDDDRSRSPSSPNRDPESPFLRAELFVSENQAGWEPRLDALESETPFNYAFATKTAEDQVPPSHEFLEDGLLFERKHGIIGLNDERDRVKNTVELPCRWICQISVWKRDANGKLAHVGPGGTGLLISPRHVLTAAHILRDSKEDDRGQWVDVEAQWVVVTPARSGPKNKPLGRYTTTAWRTSSHWNPRKRNLQWDYAIITLNEAIGAKVFAALEGKVLGYWGSPDHGANTQIDKLPSELQRRIFGTKVFTAGYPGAKGGGKELWIASGKLTAGSDELDSILSEKAEQWIKKSPFIYVTTDATKGQSGSPVWIAGKGKMFLVGLLIKGGEYANTAININDQVLHQIQDWTGSDRGPPSRADAKWESEESEVVEKAEVKSSPGECKKSREAASVQLAGEEDDAIIGETVAIESEGRAEVFAQQLRLKFPHGVRVAVYDPETSEFTRRARDWAKREEAIGPVDRKIEAGTLHIGIAIFDSRGLVATITELGNALNVAVGNGDAADYAPFLVRTLALFSHGWGATLAIGRGLTSRNAADVIKRIAPVLTKDVTIVLYGCSVCAEARETSWVTTTMEPGGSNSLCGKIRDALIDEGKTKATVWGHTQTGHTTRNWTLRVFYADVTRPSGGKGVDGAAFAGHYVFDSEKTKAREELENGLNALGFVVEESKRPDFIEFALNRLSRHMYRAYEQANKTQVYKGANLSEMAPLYPDEVADLIRKYWREVYWTKRRVTAVAKVAGRVLERLGVATKAADRKEVASEDFADGAYEVQRDEEIIEESGEAFEEFSEVGTDLEMGESLQAEHSFPDDEPVNHEEDESSIDSDAMTSEEGRFLKRETFEASEELPEERKANAEEHDRVSESLDQAGQVSLPTMQPGSIAEVMDLIPRRGPPAQERGLRDLGAPEVDYQAQLVAPVLLLENANLSGLPDIELTPGRGGRYEGFHSEPVHRANEPRQIREIKLTGRIQIDVAGVRRDYDRKIDGRRFPLSNAKAWAPAAVPKADGRFSSSAYVSTIRPDGTFTTATGIGVHGFIRRLAIKVIVEFENRKRIGAAAVLQLIDLAWFLAIVDPKEKARASSQTHLQFLASLRKMFQGGPNDPLKAGFDWVLYRHRDVKVLFAPASAEANLLKKNEDLFADGEWLDIGHVLTGIEGSPGQQPSKGQSFPVPNRPELLVTWAGDLGSALQHYIPAFVKAVDQGGSVDLDNYLRSRAGRADLVGDVDGINIGRDYDPARSLAANLNSYYGTKSRRRYHEFLANSQDVHGKSTLPLEARSKPPRLSKQAREWIADSTFQFLVPLLLTEKLYNGVDEDKKPLVTNIVKVDSPEMDIVVDYFVRFLEHGLAEES